ncbi:hypothetical protein [Winogradskyella poriferorum]|uniref:Uncharacterized protein n=1 Tax=Winogradskyella poriferorum TaxID=307627 RepID=A0ABU7W329_9FLAO
MEIKPKIGFDKIKFGMFRNEIIEILGRPDRILTDEYDENEQKLEWNKLKIRLTFQLDENDRLTYLVSKNPNLNYAGQRLIGIETEIAKNKILKELATQWEVENYDFFQTHFHEPNWLTLHSEFGEIDEIEMGVPFKNKNEYDWPK